LHPQGAADELRAAQLFLGDVTAELEPVGLPAGGVGAALSGFAQRGAPANRAQLDVEDDSQGARLDPVDERLLFATVLEVLASLPAPGPASAGAPVAARAVVQLDHGDLSVSLTAPSGVPWAPWGDPEFFDQHEFTAYGGRVVRREDTDVHTVVLRIGPVLDTTEADAGAR